VLLWGHLAERLDMDRDGHVVLHGRHRFWDDFTKVTPRRSRASGRARNYPAARLAVIMVALLILLPETRDKAKSLMVPFFRTL